MRHLLFALALLAFAAPAEAALADESTITLSLATASVQYGGHVAATGQMIPAAPGDEVVLEVVSGFQALELTRVRLDAAGSFSVELDPPYGGGIRARSVATGAVSDEVPLEVVPRVRVRTKRGLAFIGARLAARVWPASYAGKVTVTVSRDGRVVGRTHAGARGGRLRALVPTPGVGRFHAELAFPEAGGLARRIVGARLSATARTLAVGSAGPDVRALTRRLADLRIRVPGVSSTFDYSLVDSVLAFQKAYRLPRTGVVGSQTWRALGMANVLRPRYRSPGAHIEIDKTRQILLDVRQGRVVAVMPVSSGATGNTPEGKHHIRWKALATRTWLGPAILYRTMTFFGNSFAIHGFPSVPAYPASHGCVRIPIWTADWLYSRSSVGETVYIYR